MHMAQKVPKPRWRLPKDTPLALTLIFPVAFIMGLVILYPLGRGFYISLLNWRLTNPAGPSFFGLGNYLILIKDSIFFEALWNTMVFSSLSVIGGFLLGLVLALLLNTNVRFQRLFRGIALAPWIVPFIVVAFLFQLLFNYDVGVVNYALRALGIAEGNLPWLALPHLAMAAVIIANVWNQTPFYMLMLLAGLQSIPSEIVEAAIIDGANPIQLFWSILVPHLQNIIVITTILMLIRNFNSFPLIWTMTGGGPINATTTLPIYIYRLAFSDFNIGYAACVGVVWLLILTTFTALYVRRFEREVAL